jgi:hypothetical protein
MALEPLAGIPSGVRRLIGDFEREFRKPVEILLEADQHSASFGFKFRAARCLPRTAAPRLEIALARDASFPDRAIARELARAVLRFRHGHGRMCPRRSVPGLDEACDSISDLVQDWFVDTLAARWGFPWSQNERRAFAVKALARLHATALPEDGADLTSVSCGVTFESVKRCSLLVSRPAHSEAKRSFLVLLASKSPASYAACQQTIRILRPYTSIVEGQQFAKVLGRVAAIFGYVRGGDYDIA